VSRTARVVTASNRASAGVYADRGGPLIVEWLRERGYDTPDAAVVPDGGPVGEAVRASWFPDDPGARDAMTGVLVGVVKDGTIQGEIRVRAEARKSALVIVTDEADALVEETMSAKELRIAFDLGVTIDQLGLRGRVRRTGRIPRPDLLAILRRR